jgi:ppGpp synthetase/RelA/SpoT-type nucleotidyltranferase
MPSPGRDERALPIITLHHPDISLSQALNAAEQIAQRLRTLSISGGPASAATTFYTRVRVKSRESIRGKVARNQRYRDTPRSYSVADLDDLVGFRLVTLYDNELVEEQEDRSLKSAAMSYIIDLIKAGQQSSQPLFGTGLIWNDNIFLRGKFFRRRNSKADVYKRCDDWLREKIRQDCLKLGESPAPHQARSHVKKPIEEAREYSSGHLTFFALAYTPHYRIRVPVEFQFRTVIEDFWSEINHKLLYKLDNPNAWNPAFARARVLAKAASSELKEGISTSQKWVPQLSKHSISAQDEIQKFLLPNTFYHFSLCTSLFWFIDTTHKEELRPLFDEYENIIEKLLKRGMPNKSMDHKLLKEAAKLLAQAVKIVDNVRTQIASYLDGEKDEIQIESLAQQILLCRFEIIRLKTLMVLYYGHRSLGSGIEKLPIERRHPDNQRAFIRLYGEFCRFRDDRTLKLRPISAILYWKFLLAIEFDFATARLNLESAYEEMKFDLCIPKYSVYRVLIPRALANLLLEEAITTCETIAKSGRIGLDKMPGLRNEIENKLINALRLALDALTESENTNNYRGDLIFSPRMKGEALKDDSQILKIGVFYSGRIGGRVSGGDIDIGRIREIVQRARVEKLDGVISDEEHEQLTRWLGPEKPEQEPWVCLDIQVVKKGRIVRLSVPANRLRGLVKLQEHPGKYFLESGTAHMVDVDKLVLSHIQIRKIRNANAMMHGAYEGKIDRRPSITLRLRGAHYQVIDGNSTTVNAIISGWKEIQAEIID